MDPLTRRDFFHDSLATVAACGFAADPPPANVHQQLLDLAAKHEAKRRARFAAVIAKTELEALQKELRESFLRLLDGLPETKEPPPAKVVGTITADDYTIDKLTFESFPGYHVPALLYRPKQIVGKVPGVISPCGHSAVGKAAAAYQILHTNLARRGHVVLTYDPIGQGERSQFWDAAAGKSKYNLTCGEHAVLGNPLYLLGTSLAKYRIWDGVRAIDHLVTLPEVDPKRIGCVGNSGGGTLTAYIAALDPRVNAAAICCYVTTLPRRMANRIQTDPDADPEQDIYGFVSEGIDHAGLLAMRVPRPTLVGSAAHDFFPIEGARESVAEAKKLYEVAGAPEKIAHAIADEKHGLTVPLRKAVYAFFERWLNARDVGTEMDEIAVDPRATKDLLVCPDGQANLGLKSRRFFHVAMEHSLPRKRAKSLDLKDLLKHDPDLSDFRSTEVAAGKDTVLVCVNGNEARDWQEEKEFLRAVEKAGHGIVVVDPRGVGTLRPDLQVKGHDYADPLCGVEENVAYNAFLVGKSLVGMRVMDVLAAVKRVREKAKPSRLVLCGRADAAVVACFAAAIDPTIDAVAVEGVPLSWAHYWANEGCAINAASVLPNVLRDFGDMLDVFNAILPRKLLLAAGVGMLISYQKLAALQTDRSFVKDPDILLKWLQ